jgi:hypothetical protein
MCGSNNDQSQIEASQQAFYKTLNDNYTTMFGQQQAVLSALTSTFQPILQAGPLQAGYSPTQATALNTQSSETVASQYAAAQKATAQILAARGGDSTLPSSVNANILAQNTNQYAAQRAQALNQNTVNNYQMGYSNWQNAAGVLSNVANLQNPNAYAGQATGAGSAAGTTANQIAQQSNSVWNAAIGALGSIGGAALGNFGGLAGMAGGAFKNVDPGVYTPPNSSIAGYNTWNSMTPPSTTGGSYNFMPGSLP